MQSENLTNFQCNQTVKRVCHSLSQVMQHQSCFLVTKKKGNKIVWSTSISIPEVCCLRGCFNVSTQSFKASFVYISASMHIRHLMLSMLFFFFKLFLLKEYISCIFTFSTKWKITSKSKETFLMSVATEVY